MKITESLFQSCYPIFRQTSSVSPKGLTRKSVIIVRSTVRSKCVLAAFAWVWPIIQASRIDFASLLFVSHRKWEKTSKVKKNEHNSTFRKTLAKPWSFFFLPWLFRLRKKTATKLRMVNIYTAISHDFGIKFLSTTCRNNAEENSSERLPNEEFPPSKYSQKCLVIFLYLQFSSLCVISSRKAEIMLLPR